MAIWSKMGLSGPAAGAGVALVVVVVGGVILAVQSRPDVDLVQVPREAPATLLNAPKVAEETKSAESIEAAKAVAPSIKADKEVSEAAGQQAVAAPMVEEEVSSKGAAQPEPVTTPKFDVVQIEPDGGGVIAGSAAPDRVVVLMLDGVEFARAQTDRAGKFGLVLDFPASETPRALSMEVVQEDGTRLASDGTLLISPVRNVEVATDDPVSDPAPKEAPAKDAPAIVLADAEGVKLVQPAPQPDAPTTRDNAPVVANVVIDTISYDAQGEVALAGRGTAAGFVRVYLNDRPIKTTRIAEDGAWEAPLPEVDAGVYRLRIDEVNAAGAVTSRVETPFQREAPEIASAKPHSVTAVTVQPGFTLWAIARDQFGSGEQYVRVYEANRDLIRNPDLIYPGQVFALPEG